MSDYQLYQGDCLQVLPELEAGSVDAVITDPPYGINLQNHGQYAWDAVNIVTGDETTDAGIAMLRWAAKSYLPTAVFASPRLPWPGQWRSLLVWDKGPAVGGGGDIATCWKPTWELIQVARNKPLNGFRDASVLKYYIGPNNYKYHPSQKPIKIMEYLIQKLTNQGDTILDPFMGSGTTGIAALNLGRKFIGIELDEKYFKIAERRIKQRQKPLF